MDKQAELQQWKEIADSDLNLADFSAKNMWPAPYAIICFHCQQAVEKYLKWFLVSHDVEPPKTHDLEELEKLCETLQPQFSTIYEKCNAVYCQGMLYNPAIPMKCVWKNKIWIKL